MLWLLMVACGTADVASEPAGATAEPVVARKILPAVPKAEIPSGQWICDMGTVHYAAGEPGTCPICGMDLTLNP